MICYSIQAQNSPKKIKSKSVYTHSKAGMSFPLQIDNFNRTDIYSFDKKKENISITYKTADLKTNCWLRYILYSKRGKN